MPETGHPHKKVDQFIRIAPQLSLSLFSYFWCFLSRLIHWLARAMAVQAQFHNHHTFLARGGEPESRGAATAMEMTPQAPVMASPLFLDFSHGDGGNARKRPREAEAAAGEQAGLFSLQPQGQAHKVISLAQLQKRRATGLRLDFDEGSEHVSSTSSSSFLSGELSAQYDQHKNEMDQLLQEHAERFRRSLAEMRRRHYRSLIGVAEAAAARRVREKEEEASHATQRGAELEVRLARLRAEAAAWQAKALADQSAAAALHAQLQQAAAVALARGKAEEDKAAADDAESGFIDPDRVEVVAPPPARPCRTCRLRAASVVLLPCRHLCVCDACEATVSGAAASCPVCRCAVTGTVQVFFP